jgi:predicted PolB exonuclease-like 3'-5' exonuclease
MTMTTKNIKKTTNLITNLTEMLSELLRKYELKETEYKTISDRLYKLGQKDYEQSDLDKVRNYLLYNHNNRPLELNKSNGSS